MANRYFVLSLNHEIAFSSFLAKAISLEVEVETEKLLHYSLYDRTFRPYNFGDGGETQVS